MNLIEIFKAIQSPDNQIREQATLKLNELMKFPQFIGGCLELLSQQNESDLKFYAANCLSKITLQDSQQKNALKQQILHLVLGNQFSTVVLYQLILILSRNTENVSSILELTVSDDLKLKLLKTFTQENTVAFENQIENSLLTFLSDAMQKRESLREVIDFLSTNTSSFKVSSAINTCGSIWNRIDQQLFSEYCQLIISLTKHKDSGSYQQSIGDLILPLLNDNRFKSYGISDKNALLELISASIVQLSDFYIQQLKSESQDKLQIVTSAFSCILNMSTIQGEFEDYVSSDILNCFCMLQDAMIDYTVFSQSKSQRIIEACIQSNDIQFIKAQVIDLYEEQSDMNLQVNAILIYMKLINWLFIISIRQNFSEERNHSEDIGEAIYCTCQILFYHTLSEFVKLLHVNLQQFNQFIIKNDINQSNESLLRIEACLFCIGKSVNYLKLDSSQSLQLIQICIDIPILHPELVTHVIKIILKLNFEQLDNQVLQLTWSYLWKVLQSQLSTVQQQASEAILELTKKSPDRLTQTVSQFTSIIDNQSVLQLQLWSIQCLCNLIMSLNDESKAQLVDNIVKFFQVSISSVQEPFILIKILSSLKSSLQSLLQFSYQDQKLLISQNVVIYRLYHSLEDIVDLCISQYHKFYNASVEDLRFDLELQLTHVLFECFKVSVQFEINNIQQDYKMIKKILNIVQEAVTQRATPVWISLLNDVVQQQYAIGAEIQSSFKQFQINFSNYFSLILVYFLNSFESLDIDMQQQLLQIVQSALTSYPEAVFQNQEVIDKLKQLVQRSLSLKMDNLFSQSSNICQAVLQMKNQYVDIFYGNNASDQIFIYLITEGIILDNFTQSQQEDIFPLYFKLFKMNPMALTRVLKQLISSYDNQLDVIVKRLATCRIQSEFKQKIMEIKSLMN